MKTLIKTIMVVAVLTITSFAQDLIPGPHKAPDGLIAVRYDNGHLDAERTSYGWLVACNGMQPGPDYLRSHVYLTPADADTSLSKNWVRVREGESHDYTDVSCVWRDGQWAIHDPTGLFEGWHYQVIYFGLECHVSR